MSPRSTFAVVVVSTSALACSLVAGLPSDYTLAGAVDASPAADGGPDATSTPPDGGGIDGGLDACAGCGVVKLAALENGPKEIVVAGSTLYWTAVDAVRTCTLPDCKDVASLCPASDARGLALTSSTAYWSERSAKQISWAALDGGCGDAGTPTGFVPDAGNTLDGVAVDQSSLYWVATTDNALWRANLDGTGAATIGDYSYLSGPAGVLVDNGLAYVANQYSQDNGVTVTDTSDGGHATVAHGGQTLRLALDATNVYFTDRVEASGSGAVRYYPRASFDGDAGVLIASGPSGPIGLAVDSTTRTLYWTNQFDGNVLKCAIDSCTTPETVASAQGEPWGIAVDAQYVYWTNRNNDAHSAGQIMRAPK